MIKTETDNNFCHNPGSFKDPSGRVYERANRIYRSVTAAGAKEYESAKFSGIFDSLVERKKLVEYNELKTIPLELNNANYVLEHRRLDFITYPYEWSFGLLKEAALFTIELLIDLLNQDYTLSDSSAYNVQFDKSQPIFIDHLSICRYSEGDLWVGHRQFCEHFICPLLLRSLLGVPHNSWYRGNIDGIEISEFVKLLPLSRRLSWMVLAHIVLQDRFQRKAQVQDSIVNSARDRRLPKLQFRRILEQLYRWIEGLQPKGADASTWAHYAERNTYDAEETCAKKDFVAQFVSQHSLPAMIDLGCNTGDFSKISLEAGAQMVVGFDFDQQALDQAYFRSRSENLNFLPLYLDAKNPSPDQGWSQLERFGFGHRFRADGCLALAFIHHLAIAHNIPLDQVVTFIVSVAPMGVIEFVPKNDPTVQKMLTLRDDIFPDYNQEAFEAALSSCARIDQKAEISRSGRTLYAFDRS